MNRLWPWLLIPGVAFGALEAYARATVARVPSWYRAAEQIARQRPVGAVFCGSSRVQASIVPRAFDEALAARGVARPPSLNLGRGFTTDAEHFLGLRRLLSARSGHGDGLVVFLEMGALAAPWAYRWRYDAWAFEQQPEILVDVIGFRDLPGLWRSQGLPPEIRVHVTLQALLRPFSSITRRVRLRRHLGQTFVPVLARSNAPAPEPQLGVDLQGPGPASSIRTDPFSVAKAREIAEEHGRRELKNMTSIGSWAGTIPEDIVRMVQSHGGRVVFFQVPASEVFQKPFRTAMRQRDRAEFEDQARRWGACVVRPTFPTTDADFPDLWHLDPGRAPEFSAALAQAWLETCPAR